MKHTEIDPSMLMLIAVIKEQAIRRYNKEITGYTLDFPDNLMVKFNYEFVILEGWKQAIQELLDDYNKRLDAYAKETGAKTG